MEVRGYSIRTVTDLGFDEAVAKVTEELAKEGFGVLTEIDVRATMKKKLDADLPAYKILGACNPPIAFKTLQAEKEIGIMLPCNVIVYEDGGKTVVAAMNPEVALSVVQNDAIAPMAGEVTAKVKRVVAAME